MYKKSIKISTLVLRMLCWDDDVVIKHQQGKKCSINNTHTYIHIHTYTCIHTQIHTYTHTRTYIHTHTHTHIHTDKKDHTCRHLAVV